MEAEAYESVLGSHFASFSLTNTRPLVLYDLSIVFDILIIIEFTINIVAGDSSMTIEYLSSRSRPDSTKKGPQMLIELRGTCWANRRSGFSSGDRSARRRT